MSSKSLLLLPDEVIIQIVKYLDTFSVYCLSLTCPRMQRFLNDKECLRNMTFYGNITMSVADLSDILKPPARYLNVTSMNVESLYWIPRLKLTALLTKLHNLTRLNVIDTQLTLHDICNILKKKTVTHLSMHVHNQDVLSLFRDPLLREEVWNKLKVLRIQLDTHDDSSFEFNFDEFREFHCLKEIEIFGTEVALMSQTHINVIDSPNKHGKFRLNGEQLKISFIFDTIDKLLPGVDRRNTLYKCKDYLNILPDTPIPSDIFFLPLRGVSYNFKNSVLNSDHFRHIRQLCITYDQICDKITDASSDYQPSIKRSRLGVPTRAKDEQNQPIRTLINAIPKLEHLHLSKTDSSFHNEDFVWLPECLNSISLWSNLKVFEINDIAIANGKFFIEMSKGCPLLERICVCYLDPCNKNVTCRYSKDLIAALPNWKKLKFFKVEQPNLCNPRDILKALMGNTLLEYIIILKDVGCARTSPKYNLSYDTLSKLINTLQNLVYINVCDNNLGRIPTKNLHKTLRKEFGLIRDKLLIKIQCNGECECYKCKFWTPLIVRRLETLCQLGCGSTATQKED